MKKNKKIFIHDYFENLGGGERLILKLVSKNDILVTENGPVDLMANIPLEVEDIEALMA